MLFAELDDCAEQRLVDAPCEIRTCQIFERFFQEMRLSQQLREDLSLRSNIAERRVGSRLLVSP